LIDPPFLRRGASGVSVDLRVRPQARRAGLESASGVLKASVTAPPEDGKANDAVIALLAERWRLPKSSFDIVRGASARAKTVTISGEPAALVTRVVEWIKCHA